MLKEHLRYTVLNDVRRRYKLHRFQRSWRKANPNNGTFPVNLFDKDLVSVGDASYGELHVTSFASGSKIKIGSYCSIAQEVRFVINAGHRIDTISSYPFKVKTLGVVDEEATSKGDIIIEDDVWIGYRAMILDGVRIGQGAVIAAGAVVTKDVAPYTIVGGVPGKPVGRRLTDISIDDLTRIDFSKLSKSVISENIDMLYTPADSNNFDAIKGFFS